MLQGALCLFELGFVGAWIDFDQRLAFANHLPLAIVDGDDPSRDLAVEADGRDGGDGAKGVDMDANVSLADSSCLDVYDGGLIECGVVGFGFGLVGNKHYDDEYQQGDQTKAKPGTAFFHGNGRGASEGIGIRARFWTLHGYWTPVDDLVCVQPYQYSNSQPV